MTQDLLQKNVWTPDERAEFVMGSREAVERSRARANIKQLQRRLAACTDKTEEADILRSLGEWQDYLTSMTPPINYQLAAE